MITLPTLPAAPARTAEPAERPSDTADGDGNGFATALAQAQSPLRGGKDETAGGREAAGDATAPKRGRTSDTQARAARDARRSDSETPTDPGVDGAHAETSTDGVGDADKTADADAPDLAALLPGWPPAPVVPVTAATTPIAPTTAGTTTRSARAPLSIDTAGEASARTAATDKPGARAPANPFDTVQGAQDLRTARPVPAAGAGFERLVAAQAREAADQEQRSTAAAAQALAAPAPVTGAPWQATATALAASMTALTAGTNTSGPNVAAAIHEARIAPTIDSPAFAPALASQITWMANEGVQQARLSLHPAEMGPLAVQIVVDGTQARIDFSADLAATRSAIEASLPVLAAALHDSGLTLSGGGVSDGQARHGAHDARQPLPSGAGGSGPSRTEAGPILATAPVRDARGLVDLVA